MASKNSSCIFYIIILILLAGGAALFWGKFNGAFSGREFSLEEYCQLLNMNENKRAEVMFERKIKEHDWGGDAIDYEVSQNIALSFNKTEHLVNDWYIIRISDKGVYEKFIGNVKETGLQIPDPANNNRVAYKIFEKYIIYDLGFQRATKKYHIVVDDSTPSK